MFSTVSAIVRNQRLVASSISLLRRDLLTAAYGCNEIWVKRLENPLFSSTRVSDLGIILSQKIQRGEMVSPVDIDVYANKVQEIDLTGLWFAEDIMKKFRNTQQSIHQLSSTSHGIVRGFLQLGELHRLIEMLKNKSAYGIFLDDVSAVLAMDQCLDSKLPGLAARVAYELMLQEEDFKNQPLMSHLALKSCIQHWLSLQEDGWPAQEVAEEVDEEDVEYVVVKYIRNDNFDGHFDITEDRLLLGKTFCALAAAFEGAQCVSNSCRLLGLAMCEKFDLLLEEMEQIIARREPVFSDVPKDVASIVEATHTLPEGQENGYRKRCYVTEDEKRLFSAKVNALLPDLPVDENSLQSHCERHLFPKISQLEAQETEKVKKLYAEFEAERDQLFQKELAMTQRRDLQQNAKAQLRSILDREELLMSFEKKSAVKYAAWLAPRSKEELKRTRAKEWQLDIDNLAKTKAPSFLDDDE